MGITKKLLATILTFVLLLGSISVFAQGFSDYEKSVVNTVTNLSLMPYADLYGEEKAVTRSQMVTSVLAFMGVDTQIFPEDKSYPFKDVDYSLTSAKDITVAKSLGLINGVSETEFAPESAVTLAQAVKVIVVSLGYEVKAVYAGDYAAGYLTVASQLNLLRGITAGNSDALTTLSFAKLLYNALDVKLFERVSYGDEASYIESDEIPLTKFLGFSEIRGVITETEKVNLFGGVASVGKGRVCVGSTILNVGESDIADYIGYRANVYYKDNDETGQPQIRFFMTERYNKTLSLDSEDILNLAYSGNTLSLSYEGEGEKVLKVTATNAACLYNGYSVAQGEIASVVIPKITESENYTLTLIDNNIDGNYEVLKIDNYTSGVVKRVNTYSEIIYCHNFSDSAAMVPIYLNTENDSDKPYEICDKDGKSVALSDVVADSSVAVYENIDGTYRKIVVSNDVVEGTVSEVDSNGYYKIGDNLYKTYGMDFENNLGVTATFFLDINGKIIGRKSGAVSFGGYGLLMDVYVGENGGISNYPKMRILTAEGEMKDFDAENKVIAYNPYTEKVERTDFDTLVNKGETPKGYGGEYDFMIWHMNNSQNFTYDTKATDYTKEFYWRPWLTEEDKSKTASRKPVYYETNSDGRIAKVLVPDIPTGENKITLLNDNDRYSFKYNTSTTTALDMSASSSGKVPHYRLSKTATVFSVLANEYSESDYTVPSQGLSIIPNGATRKMKMYSISGGNEADIVMVYSHLPYENIANMQYVVVDYATKTDDGKTKLYGWSYGKRYEGIITEGTRLVEKIPNSSNTEYNESTRVTAKNILDFRSYSAGGKGIAPYNIATSTSESLLNHPDLKIGTKTPYADESSLKRGDIVIVGKNRGEEICYVEMAMRADACVLLISGAQDDWYSRMSSSGTYFKGVVTGLSGYDEVYMRILGEYTGSIERETTEKPDFRQTAYFDDKNVPYDFTTCKYVWVYDYKRNVIEVVDAYAIEVGDVIIGRGASTSAKDCIILKNYPAEPDFSYWENE